MTAILQRLNSNNLKRPDSINGESGSFTIAGNIESRRLLVKELKIVELQYKILITQIADDLAPGKMEEPTVTRIRTANDTAILLEQLYRNYLNNPATAYRYSNDQHVYQKLLKAPPPTNDIRETSSLSDTIYGSTQNINFNRFFFLRFRRLLITANPYMREFKRYYQCINQLTQLTAPIINYGGWIFFIPRLSTSLLLIAKHLVPHHAWMGQEEISLGWQTRLYAELEQHWFELTNDLVAFSIGLYTCFISPGPNFYLIALSLAYDAVRTVIRAHSEISRLQTIHDEYFRQWGNTKDNQDYLHHVNAYIIYEKKCQLITISHAIILVVSGILMLPIYSAPVIPILGAALALLSTIINTILQQKITQERPIDNAGRLIPHQTGQGIQRFGVFRPGNNPDPSAAPSPTLTTLR